MDEFSATTTSQVRRIAEWMAAVTGAANCAIVAWLFAAVQQPLFPLPGLYLIEIVLVGLLVLLAVALRPRPWSKELPWIAAGILSAFVILGGFSIGFYLIPAVIAFVFTGVLADKHLERKIARHVALLATAAISQATVMLLLLVLA